MKIGVIGVGSMGQNHARVLADMDCLHAVCDSDPEKAEEVGNRFDVPYFIDHRDLIQEDLDGVTIATPASSHPKICKQVIEKGLNLLVEKPIALTYEEGKKIVDSAEKKGVVFAVGMIERHNPVISTCKKLLNSGNVGDVITLSSTRVSSFPTRVSNMGVILDLGIHDIDVMKYLLDEEVLSVYALGGKTDPDDEYEDHANITLRFANNITGVVEVNWLTPHKIRNLSITCSNDFIELDYIDQTLVVSSSELLEYDASNLFEIPLEHNIRKFSIKREEPLKREMKDFIESIQGKKEPLVDGYSGLESMRVVEAAIESLEKGKEIEL